MTKKRAKTRTSRATTAKKANKESPFLVGVLVAIIIIILAAIIITGLKITGEAVFGDTSDLGNDCNTEGQHHPDNVCQVCDAKSNRLQWVSEEDGTDCSVIVDSENLTGVCMAGLCEVEDKDEDNATISDEDDTPTTSPSTTSSNDNSGSSRSRGPSGGSIIVRSQPFIILSLEPIRQDLTLNKRLDVILDESTNESYEFKVNSVSDEKVTAQITETDDRLVLNLNQQISHDLNGDGQDDAKFTLILVNHSVATIEFLGTRGVRPTTQQAETTTSPPPALPIPETPEEPDETFAPDSNGSLIGLILGLLVVVILVVTAAIVITKRKSSPRNDPQVQEAITFVQKHLGQYSESQLRESLKSVGWNESQINDIFKKIKK